MGGLRVVALAKYGYDGLDRLKQFRRGTLHANNDKISTLVAYQAYTLDTLGNWTTFDDDGSSSSQARTHDDANQISTIASWQDPSFDAAGNMTEGPKPGSGATKQQYVYDAWNRLVEVQDADDNIVAQYRYDGLHRRIRKYKRVDGEPDTWEVSEYYYNENWQALEVRKATGVSRSGTPLAEPIVSTAVSEQYLWDARYIDALVVRWHNLDPGANSDFSDTNEELYYTHDANFNVTALVAPTGSVVERYEYDAYGAIRYMAADYTSRGSSNFDNPYLYTGRRLDTDTGLYHYRRRDYDAYIARFINRDPIGYDAGDMNLYAYVGGRPTNATDPEGMKTWAIDRWEWEFANRTKTFTVPGKCQYEVGELETLLDLTPDNNKAYRYGNVDKKRWDPEKFNYRQGGYGTCWVECTRYHYDKIGVKLQFISAKEVLKGIPGFRKVHCEYVVKVYMRGKHFYKVEEINRYHYWIREKDCK